MGKIYAIVFIPFIWCGAINAVKSNQEKENQHSFILYRNLQELFDSNRAEKLAVQLLLALQRPQELYEQLPELLSCKVILRQKKGWFQCPTCHRSFFSLNTLYRHIPEDLKKQYTCLVPECQRRFATRKQRRDHHDKHHGMNAGKLREKYESVRLQYERQNPVLCPISGCAARVSKERYLQDHIRRRHSAW